MRGANELVMGWPDPNLFLLEHALGLLPLVVLLASLGFAFISYSNLRKAFQLGTPSGPFDAILEQALATGNMRGRRDLIRIETVNRQIETIRGRINSLFGSLRREFARIVLFGFLIPFLYTGFWLGIALNLDPPTAGLLVLDQALRGVLLDFLEVFYPDHITGLTIGLSTIAYPLKLSFVAIRFSFGLFFWFTLWTSVIAFFAALLFRSGFVKPKRLRELEKLHRELLAGNDQ